MYSICDGLWFSVHYFIRHYLPMTLFLVHFICTCPCYSFFYFQYFVSTVFLSAFKKIFATIFYLLLNQCFVVFSLINIFIVCRSCQLLSFYHFISQFLPSRFYDQVVCYNFFWVFKLDHYFYFSVVYCQVVYYQWFCYHHLSLFK